MTPAPVTSPARGSARASVLAASIAVSIAIAGCASAARPASSLPASGSQAPLERATTDGRAPGDVPAPGDAPARAPSGEPSASAGDSGPAPAHIMASIVPLRLPAPLSRAVAFADGGSILVCGGMTTAGTTADILRLDLADGSIAPAGRLATAVHDAAGAALGSSMVLLGGGRVTQDAVVQIVASSGGSRITGRLPAPRADLSAATVGSELVVAGGGANGRTDPRVLATADGVVFRVVATLPSGVRYAAAAALDGRLYLFGGASDSGDVSVIQAVDPSTGTARVVGHLPESLSHATAVVLDGMILVAGGRHAGRAVDSILRFDPATGTVDLVGRLPSVASDAAGAVVGATAYLVGGEAATPLASVVAVTMEPG